MDSQRDWGHAKDYVEAMWLMLQRSTPEDYVIATGHTRSVREFVEASFRYYIKIIKYCYIKIKINIYFILRHIGVTITWRGKGLEEQGVDENTGIVRVKVNEKYFRPTEVVKSYNFNMLLRFLSN